MIGKILSKLNPTPKRFLSELYKHDFDPTTLENFIKSGIDINYCDENNDTFLNNCLRNKKFRQSHWLINHGCDPSILNNNQESAIRIAIKQGNVKIARLLLSKDSVNIDEINNEGRTLLHDAALLGEDKIIDELLNRSANINIKDKNNRNILFDAISYGNNNLISKLLSINKIDINTIDNDGFTVLHKPEVLSNDELARQLLDHGADPTINDKDGKNFLFHTALKGEEGLELLDFAIEKGCNVNGKIRNNNSLLMEIMFAFTNISDYERKRRAGLIKMANKFVENGIDINAINNQGETVLFDAVKKGDIEATAFLLKKGVDVNKRSKRFETALSIAVLKGIASLDIILLLMDYKASVTIQVKDLKTILEMMNDIILHTHGNHTMENQNLLAKIDEENGHYLVVLRDMLNKTTVNIDYTDFAGDPIYFKPLLYGNFELFKLYLKYGIDVNKRNSKGKTLFHEYVHRIFEIGIANENFKQVLMLFSNNKANANISLPEDGKTIISYLAVKTYNIDLFKMLMKNIRFDLRLQDNFGRTIIHSCVIGDNIELLKMICQLDTSIINIPDYYNIVPLTYAALFGNVSMLLEMIDLDSHITSNKRVTNQAKTKFSKFFVNLDNLTINMYNSDELRKINIVTDQIKKEFGISLG